MKAFEGLKFKKKASLIHRLDPRTKFLVSSATFVIALIFPELIVLAILFVAELPLIFLAKIQKEWSRSLRGGLVLAVIILSTNLFFSYVSNELQLTSTILTYSMAMALRFITLISSFSLFFLTTSPDDLSLALEQSHVPYEFCFAFTTAVRFVPVLADEAQTIIDAQRSRGLELEKGSFLKRIRNYIPILIPLIVGAIRRSLELAEAMESRAFGAKEHRTSFSILRIRRGDYIALALSAIALAVSVYIRYRIQIPTIRVPFLQP